MTSKSKQRAAKKYQATKDRQMIYFPPGTAAAIRSQGVSVSRLCCDLVAQWLKDRGVEVVAPSDDVRSIQEIPTSDTQPEPRPGREPGTDTVKDERPTTGSPTRQSDFIPDIIDIDTFI